MSTTVARDAALSAAPSSALPPADAATFLGVSAKTLANWRSLGQGPAYVQFHGRRVAYLVEDLDAFRRANRVVTAGGDRR
ncbi:helix-turn-helix transcriptional regulator [Microbacterium sp. gxy059]|uniref:helix-turn-helix transcriptional regulator n=1 Tax=Microbacterium sp. gxy059 TaxID=2957199 RepID=UPI003D98F732